jgi:hypothetical protein
VEGEDSAEADTSEAEDLVEVATSVAVDLGVAISLEAEAFMLVARPWEDSIAAVWGEPAIPSARIPLMAALSICDRAELRVQRRVHQPLDGNKLRSVLPAITLRHFIIRLLQ